MLRPLSHPQGTQLCFMQPDGAKFFQFFFNMVIDGLLKRFVPEYGVFFDTPVTGEQ